MSILGKKQKFSDEEIIFREGEHGSQMFIILKGKVKIVKREFSASNYVVTIFEIGDFFGEMAVVRGEKRTATARALGEVECLILDIADFKMLIMYNPNFSMKLIHKLCDRAEESLVINDSIAFKLRAQNILIQLIGIVTNNGLNSLKIKSFRYVYVVEKISSIIGLEESEVDAILISLAKKNQFDIIDKKGIYYIEVSRKLFAHFKE